jgi:hypothetical protein
MVKLLDKEQFLLQKPAEWRIGQTFFNFCEWLLQKKGYPQNQSSRMADPFHVADEDFIKLWQEFWEEIQK